MREDIKINDRALALEKLLIENWSLYLIPMLS